MPARGQKLRLGGLWGFCKHHAHRPGTGALKSSPLPLVLVLCLQEAERGGGGGSGVSTAGYLHCVAQAPSLLQVPWAKARPRVA